MTVANVAASSELTALTTLRFSRLLEPVEREARGRPGLDAAGVEGVDDHDEQRRVEERQDPAVAEPQEHPRAATRSSAAPSQRLEGAEAPGDEQVHDHDRDRHQRERRRERRAPVDRVVVDDVADELRVETRSGVM